MLSHIIMSIRQDIELLDYVPPTPASRFYHKGDNTVFIGKTGWQFRDNDCLPDRPFNWCGGYDEKNVRVLLDLCRQK